MSEERAEGPSGVGLRPLSVAVAQPDTTPLDVRANARRNAEAVERADCRLVVFPELSLVGYELGAPHVAVDDPRLAPIVDACARRGSVALAGAPTRDGAGRHHVSMLRIDRDGVEVAYDKRALDRAESDRFTAGAAVRTTEVDGWRIGMAICKDTGSAIHTADLAHAAVDLVVAGLVHTPDEADEHEARGFVIARACRAYVALASAAGVAGGGYDQACGRSSIWDPDGARIAGAGERPGDLARCTLRAGRGTRLPDRSVR